jgi:S-adenosylmethionine synthetase
MIPEYRIFRRDVEHRAFEFVERKGIGHPDSLADGLAEHLSRQYSRHTRDAFGAVLHHNFDKVGLLGGRSRVVFGEGKLTSPIRVLLNGRVSGGFGETVLPVRQLLVAWTKTFFELHFNGAIDVNSDLEFHFNLSEESSPGRALDGAGDDRRRYRFRPRGLHDLQELERLAANDTSLGVGYAPRTPLEKITQAIDSHLLSAEFRSSHPWIGSDIKILGFRTGDEYRITMCIPQIARHVRTAQEYAANLEVVRDCVAAIVARTIDTPRCLYLALNTRDDLTRSDVYLTATGSSIESGDEGLVGRGNRINGFVNPTRPMSMEGACGKNPVYHAGKLYYVAAMRIADAIHASSALPNEVYLASQNGRDLVDPWLTVVVLPSQATSLEEETVRHILSTELQRLPLLTDELIAGMYSMY